VLARAHRSIEKKSLKGIVMARKVLRNEKRQKRKGMSLGAKRERRQGKKNGKGALALGQSIGRHTLTSHHSFNHPACPSLPSSHGFPLHQKACIQSCLSPPSQVGH